MKKVTVKKATVKRVTFTIETTDSCRRVKSRFQGDNLWVYYDGAGKRLLVRALKVEDVGPR